MDGLPGKTLLPLKMAWKLRFAKLHLNEPQDFWNNEQMRPKWRYLAIMTSTTFDENQMAHQHKHPITTVKHGAELIMNTLKYNF